MAYATLAFAPFIAPLVTSLDTPLLDPNLAGDVFPSGTYPQCYYGRPRPVELQHVPQFRHV